MSDWGPIRDRARTFARRWARAHYEKGQTHPFYWEFFPVFDVDPLRVAVFERSVRRLRSAGFVDLFWPGLLLVEQKSEGLDLEAAIQQGLDYTHGLPDAQLPRWLMACDFQTFRLIDLRERTEAEFELADLPERVEAFAFIVEARANPFPPGVAPPRFIRHLIAENSAFAEQLDLQDTLVRALAIEYAPDSAAEFKSAVAGLRAALQTAADLQRRASLPQNTGEQVQAVLRRVAELNDQGQIEAAAAEFDRGLVALDEEESGLQARRVALLTSAIEQDRLRNNPASAAVRLVRKAEAEGNAGFEDLTPIFLEWYQRGRDAGPIFDLAVAVDLARLVQSRASTEYQRGTALNMAGLALSEIGRQETTTERLKAAVAAFCEAISILSHLQINRDLATLESNLGATLREIGLREGGVLGSGLISSK